MELDHRVGARAENSQGESLVSHFEEACARYGDAPAFHCFGRTLSFNALEEQSRYFAAYLRQHLGMQQGERLAIQLPNISQYPIAAWGALRAGLIIVNTNPLYTERELVHQLQDSGAKVLVSLVQNGELLAKVLPQTDVEHVVLVALTENDSLPASDWFADAVETFDEALVLGKTADFDRPALSMDAVLALQYTGGTTGLSKGAILTHGNMHSAVRQVDDTLGILEPGAEVFLAPLPLYHVYGFNSHVIGNVLRGGLSVLIPDPRNVDSLISALLSFQVTVIPAINTLFAALLNHPRFTEIDFGSLKICTAGGAALITDVAKRWEQVTGCCITEGYGMSETAGVATFNRPGSQQLGTIGLPPTQTELRVVCEKGGQVANGSEGELLIRGPQVMQGYWNQLQATQEAFDAEGWLRTGDIAVMQDDGHVRLVDRKKDMILVSGFNVYPNEVEEVASGHAGVLECAAIGVSDDKSGEAVMLFVVKALPELVEGELRGYCRQHLAAYKVPKYIHFITALPKSNVGKILRRELREQISSGVLV